MQAKKNIKIPKNLAYQIQNNQSNAESSFYFTVFSASLDDKYVIDIATQNPSTFPIVFGNAYGFERIQEKINKDNKAAVLEKYTVCSCDEVNQISKKFMIINIQLTGYTGVDGQFIGYSLYSSRNGQTDRKNVGKQQFQAVLKLTRDQASQIWSNYNGRYCRSLSDKKLKAETDITYALQPFLEFEVSALTSPKDSSQFVRRIEELQVYNTQYAFLFPIKEETYPENNELSNKLLQFVKEKLISKEYRDNSLTSIPFLSCPRANPKKIFNPHIFAKSTRKQRYEVILVKGIYEYYHYGDQSFTDNGWGCAYRALQTLLSWLHIQGHTQTMHQMMSIRSIQEKLDQFDRSRKLKGSSTWIGATEISWIVPAITTSQINCKILHVSDGKQILQKCQQFKNHFLTSGCPIMYGGGEYAYSIVGMNYNWKLGECEFLILDPHYTGEDDFGKIIEKKGLAWRKPEDMFKKGVFYNFCLPLIK